MSFKSPQTRKLETEARESRRQDRKANPPPKRPKVVAVGEPGAVAGVRQREPRQLDATYLAWLHTLPCTGCTARGEIQKTRTEAAHPKFGEAQAWREFGASERSHDRMAVPLCSACHRGKGGEHDSGQRAYWVSLGIRLTDLVPALNDAFPNINAGIEVIRSFATLAGAQHIAKPQEVRKAAPAASDDRTKIPPRTSP